MNSRLKGLYCLLPKYIYNTDRILAFVCLHQPLLHSLSMLDAHTLMDGWIVSPLRLPACFPVPLLELRNKRAFLAVPLFNFVLRIKKALCLCFTSRISKQS